MSAAQRVVEGPVAALAWTQAGPEVAAAASPCTVYEDRARRFFPAGVGREGSEGGAAAASRDGDGADEAAAPPGSDAWPREPEHLALLACASASGDILLCAGRLFPVAALRLRSLLGTEDVTLRQV